MPTVAERLAIALADHADEVFGLLGNGNAFLVDAMLRLTELRFTAVRHEVATVASADAYSRATRKLAIATATYGAGFTNTVTALTEAAMYRTPMIVVVGDAPTAGPRPWDIDQVALAASCGVPTITVRADYVAAAAHEAAHRAITERRPVVLALPYDLPTATAQDADDLQHAHVPAPAPLAPTDAAVTELATALAAAERPVMLTGRGAREAATELRELADRFGAITVTTAPARGMFEGRELDAGVCGGFSSEPTAALLGQADLVLTVGAGLNQFTVGFGQLFPQAKLLQVDILDRPTHPSVSSFVRADAQLTARALLQATEGARTATWPGLDAAAVSRAQFDRPFARTSHADAPTSNGLTETGKLDPRALSAELDRVLPEQRLIASDGGHFIGWANTYLRVPSCDSVVLVGTAFQSIGLGFSSAPGAALAANAADRMLVVVTGDGGGLMALADLDSIVRTAERATVVVFNDAAYTAEVTQYGTLGLDERPMRIEQVSFARLGEAVGARGTEVRTLDDLAEWRKWAASGERGTWVLDCRIDGEVIAPYQLEIMANLKRQAAEQK